MRRRQAHQFSGGLDGDGVGFDEEVREKPIVLEVEAAGFVPAASGGGVDEVGHGARDDVGGDADDANRTDSHHGQGEAVIAGQHGDVAGGLDAADAVHAAAGFLDADHVRMPGQRSDGGHGNFAGGAPGHIVEHDWQAEVGHRREVADQAGLRGLVVVGGDLERAVGADLPGPPGQLQGFRCGVAAGARDDFDAAGGGLYGDADDLDVFMMVQGGRLAGGADWHHPIYAASHLKGDQLAQALHIHLARGVEWSDQCCECA